MKTQTLKLILLLFLGAAPTSLALAQSREADSLKVVELLDQAKNLQNDPPKANQLIRSGLAKAREIGSGRLIAFAYGRLAFSKYMEGNGLEAIPLLDSTKLYAQQVRDTALWENALNMAGVIYIRMGDPGHALLYLEESLQLNLALDNQRKVAMIYNNMANAYKTKGNLTEAKAYYYKVLTAPNTPIGSAIRTHNNLRNLFHSQGQLDSAIWHNKEALRLLEKTEEPEMEVLLKLQLGTIYTELDDQETAFQIAREVRPVLTNMPMETTLWTAYHTLLSEAYSEIPGRLDSAIQRMHLALQSVAPVDTVQIVGIWTNLAEYHSQLGQLDSSYHYIQKAEATATKAKLYKQYLGCKVQRVINLIAEGEFETALQQADSALVLANRENYGLAKAELYQNLQTVHDSLGNLEQAYHYFKAYASLKDSIYNSRTYYTAQEIANQKQIAATEQQFSTRMAAIAESKRRTSLLTAGVIIVVLFLLVYTWWYFKNRESKTLRYLLSRLSAIGPTKTAKPALIAEELLPMDVSEMEELLTELQRIQVFAEHLDGAKANTSAQEDINQVVQQKIDYLEGLQFSISHDLKRYVLNLQNQLSQLISKNQPLAPLEVAPIQQTTEEMIVFMEQLKEIHRIDELAIQNAFIDLQDLIQDVLRQLSPEQNYPGVQVDIRGQLPTVKTDPLLARQVITNLLENALKYSQSSTHPKVEIGLSDGNPEPALYVKDNGEGIPEEEQTRIFEPFYRSKATKAKGTGLGLAISRMAAQKLGGEISVKSKLGEGSIFYFALGT
ncbi:ATP-binding protein [Phaeodactylibacter sp.]|uniref:ATP-binding protein n=1 Tax=Phaeodactylibacter sp. TaxID=1940289 RepID=UPI0025E268A7|nr:ATP-binding protein [Phaeodactylibacter sp.]MCI4648424.1 ATP-binding protein [Phaeodactylibacter sp.]MCI5093154.1 ATP-binding protein [Phaeodactylibacter sp.]